MVVRHGAEVAKLKATRAAGTATKSGTRPAKVPVQRAGVKRAVAGTKSAAATMQLSRSVGKQVGPIAGKQVGPPEGKQVGSVAAGRVKVGAVSAGRVKVGLAGKAAPTRPSKVSKKEVAKEGSTGSVLGQKDISPPLTAKKTVSKEVSKVPEVAKPSAPKEADAK